MNLHIPDNIQLLINNYNDYLFDILELYSKKWILKQPDCDTNKLFTEIKLFFAKSSVFKNLFIFWENFNDSKIDDLDKHIYIDYINDKEISTYKKDLYKISKIYENYIRMNKNNDFKIYKENILFNNWVVEKIKDIDLNFNDIKYLYSNNCVWKPYTINNVIIQFLIISYSNTNKKVEINDLANYLFSINKLELKIIYWFKETFWNINNLLINSTWNCNHRVMSLKIWNNFIDNNQIKFINKVTEIKNVWIYEENIYEWKVIDELTKWWYLVEYEKYVKFQNDLFTNFRSWKYFYNHLKYCWNFNDKFNEFDIDYIYITNEDYESFKLKKEFLLDRFSWKIWFSSRLKKLDNFLNENMLIKLTPNQ